MSEICVVGSINMDVVTYVDVFPTKGQTMYGKKILQFPGGKGANQAISCARQNKKVTLISAVGKDQYGKDLLHHLQDNHVDISHVKQLPVKTGQTTIITNQEGDNSIILLQGANRELSPEDVALSMSQLKNCKIMLVQMETEYETVLTAMKKAKKLGIYVILDPAPANKVDDVLLQYADLILPNEHEVEMITGIKITDEDTARQAITIIKKKGVPSAILKVGAIGSYVYQNDTLSFVKGLKVEAVDTVGAGDSFAGGIATALLDGQNLDNAAAYATIVAALKVTKEGAQVGIPTISEVMAFCRERNISTYRMDINE